MGARFTETTTDAGGAIGERLVTSSTRRANEDGAGTHALAAARRPRASSNLMSLYVWAAVAQAAALDSKV